MRSARRVLYTPERVHTLFAKMKSDLAAMHFKHLCELSDLRRELDTVRAEFEELKDVVRRRVAAEAELASLRRERQLMLALSAERDPAMPLQ